MGVDKTPNPCYTIVRKMKGVKRMGFADNFFESMKGLATNDRARMETAAKRDEELIKIIRESKTKGLTKDEIRAIIKAQ